MRCRHRRTFALALAFATTLVARPLPAQAEEHIASPRGSAECQMGGKSGKWITVDYGRPLLRGRSGIFGAGPEYGKQVNAGAPVWRAGANATTRIRTELPMTVNGKKIAAGDYAVFIDLKEGAWTLVLSTQPSLDKYQPKAKDKIWGSYGYDPKFDVVRAPMTLGKSEPSVEQLTISFLDVGDKGGTLQLAWEHTTARVPFTVD